MTRQATARFYAEWDTIYAENINGQRYWGSVDHHLVVGVNDAGTIEYKPIIRFPINFAGMVSVISAQVVVTTLWGTHFSLKGASPSWVMGRLSSPPPDHQNAATLCGGGGLANNTTSAYSPGWDSVSSWPSHNAGWAYGIDATAAVQAIWGGYPNYGFIFGAYNLANHRSEFGSNDSGYTAYLDITYEVPNEAPTTPWAVTPGNASYGNSTGPLVRIANSGDADSDPGGGAVLQYGVVNNYGEESWQTQIGTSGFDGNPGQYIGDFYPSLTRGKWHCFRGIFWDHHGAYSAWSGSWWHYVYAVPNAPSIVSGMQPIHNLNSLAQWSGNEARPTLRITPSDPDGKTQNRIEFEISTDQVSNDWTGAYEGSYGNGVAYDFNIPFGLPNDLTRYVRARTRDTLGNWGAWCAWTAIKVRWAQAIYQYNGGTASGQYAYYMGALSGSSPSAAAIFRSATGSGGAGAGPWVATIGEIGQPEWLNILVRLAIGRNTSTPTTLTSMSITFLGAAQQPDEWAFHGLDTDFWQLDTSTRRYGTKSLKFTRQTPVATGDQATAMTDRGGDAYIVPVVPNTEYTLSVWVKGTLTYGNIRGVVVREGNPVPIAQTDVTDDTQGDWQRLRVTFTTSSDVSEVAVGVTYEATADGLGDIFWVDAVQIEEGPVASVWNPGQTGAVIMDVGGVSINGKDGASFRLRGTDGGLFDTVELGSKGLTFGDKWQVYSDGTTLYASDGVSSHALTPTPGSIWGKFALAATWLPADTWNTMSVQAGGTCDGVGVVIEYHGTWGWGFRIKKAGWYATNINAVLQASPSLLIYAVKRNGTPGKHDGQQHVPWQSATTIDYYNVNDFLTAGCYISGGSGTTDQGGEFVVIGVGSGPQGPAGPAGEDGADGADGDTIINNISVDNRSIGARVRSAVSTYQTVNSNTWTAPTMAVSLHDTDGFWTVALPTKFTVPANCPSGIYHLEAAIRVEPHTAAARDIQAIWQKNGTWQTNRGSRTDAAGGQSNWPYVTSTLDLWLNPGDVLEPFVYHVEGAACYIGDGNGFAWDCNTMSITYVGSGSAAGTAVEGTEVGRSTTQTYTADQTAAVIFDQAIRDQGGLWAVSPNPTRVTVSETGWYAVSGYVQWAAGVTSNNRRVLYLRTNGTWTREQTDEGDADASAPLHLSVNDYLYLTAGSYVELVCRNYDTASKDISFGWLRLVKFAAGADSTYEPPVITDAPGVAVYRNAAVTLTNGGAYIVSWDVEKWDTHGFWNSGSPTRFTIPVGHAGRYRFTWRWGLTGEAGVAYRLLSSLKVNGVDAPHTRHDLTMRPGVGYSYNVVNGSAELTLNVGDYVELLVYEANDNALGASLYVGNVSEGTSMAMTRLATGPQGEKGDKGDTGDPGVGVAPTGVISPYVGAAAPTGWLLCDGSSVSRTTYAALFALIGTTYGSVDGNTFNVPNLKGKVIVGVDAADTTWDALGETGGAKTKSISAHSGGSVANEAAHTHGVNINTGSNGSWTNVDNTPISSVAAYDHGHTVIGNTGAGTSHGHTMTQPSAHTALDVVQPFMALNYIIKT